VGRWFSGRSGWRSRCLRVDDELWDGQVPQPDVGTTYSSLTGVLPYRYDNHKLLPRSDDDAEEAR